MQDHRPPTGPRSEGTVVPSPHPKVVILDDYQGVALTYESWSRLTDRIEIDVVREHLGTDAELIPRIIDAEVLVMMRERTPLSADRIDQLPNLKLIVTKGMQNAAIDVGRANIRGITVCGTPGRREAPVELTWALILALARHLCDEHTNMRAGGWQQTVGTELWGRTLGVVGLGRLGRLVAEIGAAFGMNVVAWSQNLTDEAARTHGVLRVSKEELLHESDFITLHTRLSDRTRGLIAQQELEQMKPTAYLVNTSRGPLIDEAALIAALHAGAIAGAGLDVYDTEPLPRDHPLRTAPNVVLSPHLGYVAVDSYERHFTAVVEAIVAWIDGAPIRTLIR